MDTKLTDEFPEHDIWMLRLICCVAEARHNDILHNPRSENIVELQWGSTPRGQNSACRHSSDLAIDSKATENRETSAQD